MLFGEIAVAFELARFGGGFCGGERGGRQVLSDPKRNSVASVPGKDVAIAKDDVFEGV